MAELYGLCNCGHPICFTNGRWRHNTSRHYNYGRKVKVTHGRYGSCKCKKAELLLEEAEEHGNE